MSYKKKKSVFGIRFSILGILLITGALGICFYYLFIFNKNGEEVFFWNGENTEDLSTSKPIRVSKKLEKIWDWGLDFVWYR